MRSQDVRIPELSRDLIKQLDVNFPAPSLLEMASMDPRALAFKAGCRYMVESCLDGLAADDEDANKEEEG